MSEDSRIEIGLRTRILLIALAMLLVATSGAIVTAGYLINERLIQAQQSRAEAIARGLNSQLQRLFALGIALDQLQGFEDQCREAVEHNEGLSQAMVIAPDGRILFHNDPSNPRGTGVDGVIDNAISTGERFLRHFDSGNFFVLQPVSEPNGAHVGTIAVGFPFSLVEQERNHVMIATLLVSIVAIGVGMLLLLFTLSRYVIGPITSIVTATERLRATGDAPPGQRLPASDLYEFSVMANGINRLLDRVEEHERALHQAKDVAVAANRAKTAFLANMSHELRTPMNAIMGFTELSLRSSEEPRTRDYLEKMRTAERNLLAIIADVLDLSRIEAERLTIECKPFNVGQLVDKQIRLIEHAAEDKSLTLETEIAGDLDDLVVTGDPQRLGQVLLNLMSNAVKFTHEGRVTVRARVTDRHDDTVTLRVEVQDTGIGIATIDQARLFQPFEQVDNSRTRNYGGTGIGLAISKRIVEMMNGRIGVRSQPGKGSTFWFVLSLPLAESASTRIETAEPETPDNAQLHDLCAGMRILVVEDDAVNQLVISDLLDAVGLTAEIAGDGQQALELVDPERHALVLMDVHMPNMDGVTAVKEMRKQHRLLHLPILAVTANAFDENRERCLSAGMNDFIEKPVEADEFYATLGMWLKCREAPD